MNKLCKILSRIVSASKLFYLAQIKKQLIE